MYLLIVMFSPSSCHFILLQFKQFFSAIYSVLLWMHAMFITVFRSNDNAHIRSKHVVEVKFMKVATQHINSLWVLQEDVPSKPPSKSNQIITICWIRCCGQGGMVVVSTNEIRTFPHIKVLLCFMIPYVLPHIVHFDCTFLPHIELIVNSHDWRSSIKE
jgi:hypothetical protein